MRGGKREAVHYYEPATFLDFAHYVLQEQVASTFVNHRKKIGGGFATDFTTWLKLYADPYHDFKGRLDEPIEFHHDYKKVRDISTHILIRTYHDILTRQTVSQENSILVKLLQDRNLAHGLSLKYMRFYKAVTEDDNDTQFKQVWRNIENAFDGLRESYAKFFIMNAAIQGGKAREFSDQYARIVPLSVYWDSVSSTKMNFFVEHDEAAFYNSVYDEVTHELFQSTGIRMRLYVSHDKVSMILSLTAANNVSQTFIIARKGFSAPDLSQAINKVVDGNIHGIEVPELNASVGFLSRNGATKSHIISYLLTCKMSGDAGVVKFIEKLCTAGGMVNFEGTQYDLSVGNTPIIFLYTADGLCAANAIANDVKCVLKCQPNRLDQTRYITQYLGSEASFDIKQFIQPYWSTIQEACKIAGVSVSKLNTEQLMLQNIPFLLSKLCSKVFPSSKFTMKFPQLDVDGFVRYVLAVCSIIDMPQRISDVLKFVLRNHKKLRMPATLLDFQHLDALYDYCNAHGMLDPVIQFYNEILLIPDTGIQTDIYNQLQTAIRTKLGVEIKSALTELLNPDAPRFMSFSVTTDQAMLETARTSTQKESTKKKTAARKPRKRKSDDSDYDPTDDL
jgi:hypothetical protein